MTSVTGLQATGSVGTVTVQNVTRANVTGVSATGAVGMVTTSTSGVLKNWNGFWWQDRPVKVWNGSAWVVKPIRRWNGNNWI